MVYVVKVIVSNLTDKSLAEHLLIFAQPPARKGDTAPLRFFSIASSVTIALGLLCVTYPPASDNPRSAHLCVGHNTGRFTDAKK